MIFDVLVEVSLRPGIADPQGSLTTSRYNVSVQAGETLDIGSMDLGICGQPQQPATPAQDSDQPADSSTND